MSSHRLRFELLFALGCVAFGALVLPGLVYAVGVLLLGTYAQGGLWAFYANLYADVFAGSLPAASLILGPYAILMLARIPLIGRRPATSAAHEEEPAARAASRSKPRIEPRIGN